MSEAFFSQLAEAVDSIVASVMAELDMDISHKKP